jgi:hypothetical protein
VFAKKNLICFVLNEKKADKVVEGLSSELVVEFET